MCKFCWVEPFAWDIFPAAKFEFGTRNVSPFCARPKRSHYKAVTSQIAQKTRVLWLTRGFPEEKLLWSDSWAQDCKLQGQDSHNESMCVSFLKRKRIRERSGLIWTRVRLGKNSIRPALQSCFSEKPQHLNVALIYVTSATVGLVLLVAIIAIQD